jgi:hypothetical protein
MTFSLTSPAWEAGSPGCVTASSKTFWDTRGMLIGRTSWLPHWKHTPRPHFSTGGPFFSSGNSFSMLYPLHSEDGSWPYRAADVRLHLLRKFYPSLELVRGAPNKQGRRKHILDDTASESHQQTPSGSGPLWPPSPKDGPLSPRPPGYRGPITQRRLRWWAPTQPRHSNCEHLH